MGAHFRYPQLAIVSGVALLTLGISQSQHLYHGWPDSTQMIAMLGPELEPKGHYLIENDAVPKYYFRTESTPEQWTSTYYFDYTIAAVSGSQESTAITPHLATAILTSSSSTGR